MNTYQLLFLFCCLFSTNIIIAQTDYSMEELDSLHRFYASKSMHEKTLYYAKLQMEKLDAEGAAVDSLYIRKLNRLGVGYFANQELEKALSILLRTEKLGKKILGEQSGLYAAILLDLANLYSEREEYEQAEKYYKKSIAIYQLDMKRYDYNYTRAISNLAILYDYMGHYEEAEVLYKEAVENYRTILGDEHPEYADALISLGIFYDIIEKFDLAESYYLEAQATFKRANLEGHIDYTRCIGNLGLLYLSIGYYEQSESLLLECLKRYIEFYGEDEEECSSVLIGLGSLYDDMKRYEESEHYYLRALKIDAAYLGEESYNYGITLNNLAVLYDNMGQLEKAKAAYLKVKDIFAERLGKEHQSYGVTLNNLASVGIFSDDFEEAEVFAKEAEAVNLKAVGTYHSSYLMTLSVLAEIYKHKKDNKQSWEYSFKAIRCNASGKDLGQEINEAWVEEMLKTDFISIPEVGLILHNMFELLTEEQGEKQLLLIRLMIDLLEQKRHEFINELDKLEILKQGRAWVERGLKTAVNLKNHPYWEDYKKSAFSFAEMNKSVLLAGAIQTEKAYTFGDLPDSLAQKEQALLDEYADVKAILQDDISEEEQSEMRGLLSELGAEIKLLKEEIDVNYPRYSKLKYSNTTVEVAEVQALLDDKTALLEYVISDAEVFVFYLDKKTLKLFETKVPIASLTHKILLMHQALSDYGAIIKAPEKAYERYVKTANWFYEFLLAKVLKEAKGIEHLVIIADRELGHLPFEAFLTKLPNQINKSERGAAINSYQNLPYLVNDYTISYDYSATLWKENQSEKDHQVNGRIFALAGDYNTKTAKNLSAVRLPTHQRLREKLEPLPAARQEVQILEKNFDGDFIYGAAANERIFKEKAGDYGIIHLAMHGVLDRRSPILSSLVFTEDGDSVENNFLQAYEISQMHLNAGLVVLSACETGFGKFEQGNGIASLARSFMYAGVPSMVVSLWQVNDQSTGMLMQSFYQNLRKGMNKAVALRQAKLDYIKEAKGIGGHPAFWSAFIQLGNSQAILIDKEGRGMPWAWGILGLVMVGLLGIGVKFWKGKELSTS